LLKDLKHLIEQGKKQAIVAVNSALTLPYWHIGKRINEDILNNKRAGYGKQIVTQLATQLVMNYGKSFEPRKLLHIMQFAELFPDLKKVSPLLTQLSWTHLLRYFQLKEARLFYARKSAKSLWNKHEQQKQIGQKAFERFEIANTRLAINEEYELSYTFKDPYFLDFIG
jgi:hypothetical protein